MEVARDQVSQESKYKICSGYKELKRGVIGPSRAEYYKFSNARMLFPFINDWERINSRKIKYEERRMRIFMRGVKIGAKRQGNADKGMTVFEMKEKKSDATEAQQRGEAASKQSMSDESLGLTSE